MPDIFFNLAYRWWLHYAPPTLHLHPHVVTFIRLPGLRRLEVLGDTPAKGMALEP